MRRMNLREAAGKLGVQAATLRQQIANKRLRARKMGRDWYVTEEELARYQREIRGRPGPKGKRDDDNAGR